MSSDSAFNDSGFDGIGRSHGTDYFRIRDQLTEQERAYLDGTETIQTLIVGRDITGVGAFA